jgi:arsenite methyltransferase
VTRGPAPALDRLAALLDDPPPAPPAAGHPWWDLVDGRPGARGRVQDLWQSTGGAGVYDATLAGLVRLHGWVPDALGGEVLRDFFGVADRLGLHDGQTVLDLACGPGTLTRLLADAVGPTGLVVGADLSAPMLDRAARTVQAPQVAFARMDAMDLPLADGCVDAVCCSLCLHLVPHLETALDEILRVLAPGAPMALAVPAHAPGAFRALSEQAGRSGEMRVFAPGELAGVLRGLGAQDVRERHGHLLQVVDARAPAGLR